MSSGDGRKVSAKSRPKLNNLVQGFQSFDLSEYEASMASSTNGNDDVNSFGIGLMPNIDGSSESAYTGIVHTSYTKPTDDVAVLPVKMEILQGMILALLDRLLSQSVSEGKDRREMILSLHSQFVHQKVFIQFSSEKAWRRSARSFNRLFDSIFSLHQFKPTETLIVSFPKRIAPMSDITDARLHDGRYRDEFQESGSPIGAGAYGNVFKCQHHLDKKEYAVKQIHFKAVQNQVIRKILREATYLASLENRNIVRYCSSWLERSSGWKEISSNTDSSSPSSRKLAITPEIESRDDIVSFRDSCECRSIVDQSFSQPNHLPNYESRDHSVELILFIQMELCTSNLSDWLEKRNNDCQRFHFPPDHEVCLSLVKQLLLACKYIHNKGIIHRDLKPNNIFLQKENDKWIVKIGDFGLARDHKIAEPMTPAPGWDLMSPLVGTFNYAAPEQLSGQNYTFKADMYSAGLIMVLIFVPFYTLMERNEVLGKLRNQPFSDVCGEFCENFPNEGKVITKLLFFDDHHRPTAEEAFNALFVTKDQEIDSLKKEVSRLKREVEKLRRNNEKLNAELESEKKSSKFYRKFCRKTQRDVDN